MRLSGPLHRAAAAGLLVLGAAALFLGGLEAAVRLLRLAPQTASFYQPDPDLGARLVPGARGIWRKTGFEVAVAVNALGFRDVEHAREKPPGVCRVAFLGDSFVEAMQVPLERTFFRRFEEEWNRERRGMTVESLAFGVSGFGTAQEYLAWKRYAAPFRPDLVVLAFLPGNDIRNNVFALEGDPGRPYLIPEGESLRTFWPRGSPPAAGWWRRAARLFFPQGLAWLRPKLAALRERLRRDPSAGGLPPDYRVYAPPYPPEWERGWAVTEAVLRRLDVEVSGSGGRLLVLILDDLQEQVEGDLAARLARRFPGSGLAWDPEAPFRRLADFCRREGIECLDLLPVFRREYAARPRLFHFPDDGHWNEEGHRLAARALADYLASPGEGCPGGRR